MACTAAIGRRKMHLSARIVAPEGVAFFSAPPYSNDYYFHTCDAEGNCSESTADIVALGVLGAGRMVLWIGLS